MTDPARKRRWKRGDRVRAAANPGFGEGTVLEADAVRVLVQWSITVHWPGDDDPQPAILTHLVTDLEAA